MDFLRTLMVYMMLLSSLSVQEGPLPQAVPTPTMLPPSVTATLVPHQTEAPTATPGPTGAPVPTITPNLRYETMKYQDRGTPVRKLQNRLIALGYMPEGSADGAYGYQTYNAVKAFQKANGLEADGVAGPATQTVLYEYDHVVANTTATPAPTASPTPTFPPLPTLEPLPEATVAVTAVPAQASQTAAPSVAPAATAAPTEAPAAQTSLLGLTELPDAHIISGATGEALSRTVYDAASAYVSRPRLFRNTAGDAVMVLHEIADCMDGWLFMGSSADGFYTLNAQGYAITIHCTNEAVMVTVDGLPVSIDTANVQALDGQLFVTADFLEKTMNASTIFDEEERSLVFFIPDKAVMEAVD